MAQAGGMPPAPVEREMPDWSHIRRRLRVHLETLRGRLIRHPRATVATVLFLAVIFWSTAGALAWFTYEATTNLPNRKDIASIGEMAQATVLFDAANKPVFTIFKEQRIEVPLSSMSPQLVQAVLAIEDQRYYDHGGVDFVRIFGAAMANLRTGRRWQGASTITQQLARQSFLTPERTFRRKLKEALLAALIERSYSKEEILEFYLNKVYFGDGLYGVEAAARGFFGKSTSSLSLAEAAMLAGLIKSPSNYAPTINLDKAIARRNLVLQAMLDSRVIDRASFDRARTARVVLRNGLQRDEHFGLYFKEQVRRELVERFGWPRVSAGGLRVYTTIDSAMQQAAEEVVEEGLTGIEARSSFKHPKRHDQAADAADEGGKTRYLQGSLVAIDPRTGFVRVMVGGRNFRESRFNRAVQARRQPGSAFKPFIYAAGLEAGMSPATMLTDLDEPTATPQGVWMPEDEHSSAPSMSVRTALRTSSNRAAVRAIRTVGLRRTVESIARLNFGSMPRVPSLALGAAEVTLQSLTSAYGAFANAGAVAKPILIRRVEDREGNVLLQQQPQIEVAFSDSTAFLMANMLQDVINAGTANRARALGFTLPAAGKTGTTNDYMDAWFVGFTPNLVSGVWIGFDRPRQIIPDGYGGTLAVPVWAEFMKIATRDHKPDWIKRPSSVVGADICRQSGKRPVPGCESVEVLDDYGMSSYRSMVYTEYFARGTAPVEDCDLHTDSGVLHRLAGIFGADGHPKPVTAEPASGAAERATAPAAPARVSPEEENKPRAVAEEQDQEKVEAGGEKKKRGFWSRLFGRGKKDNDKKPSTPDERRQDPQPRTPRQ
jgi:1A family penicillin-binding protein